MVDHLGDIMGFLLARDYVRGMESYVLLTIGNAPWPMVHATPATRYTCAPLCTRAI